MPKGHGGFVHKHANVKTASNLKFPHGSTRAVEHTTIVRLSTSMDDHQPRTWSTIDQKASKEWSFWAHIPYDQSLRTRIAASGSTITAVARCTAAAPATKYRRTSSAENAPPTPTKLGGFVPSRK